ncbi:Gfo/Idh/MocA family oxidoreductase [Arthrobacter sp. AK01]|uniref:Gfo/Idh/MocA family protein n=1 Tax=Micrococcaceae TaxID=1268 RepID=UPI001E45E122|nr:MULTISPECIES: Gfo/Idh/MocA family oxidoreductase [Micrococcaceae]MCD4851570.1 Gfo/Idh/MocA family oxidoreductase [Arthrobacter sp. AK01]MCP1412397.1 1,5-anhydro-D-fructose reductase (1,5-anhydro-D-mannitol-forming) [Paenarthrobacter sp. A20]
MNEDGHLVWGLVGASDIAATRMIPAFRRVGDLVAGVFSNDAKHAKSYAQRHDIARHHGTLEELLSDGAIDAVYISSRNEYHSSQALAAAAAGKHILCEKPVATTLEDAYTMIGACRANDVVLAVNHHLPAAGTHRTIRELVAAGAIGRPLSANVRHSTLLPERLRGWRLESAPGAGVVMDLSCHNASVVNPLLGTRPLDVVATTLSQGSWPSGADDASSASIRYDGGVLVDFQDSFTLPFTPSFIRINGEQGSLVGLDVMTPEPVGSVHLTDNRGCREILVGDRRHSYDITLEHFRLAVRSGARPVVDGLDAANNLAVSLAIQAASNSGKREEIRFMER